MKDRLLPAFASEEEERDFWTEHDSTDYVGWSRAERVILPMLAQGSASAERDESAAGDTGPSMLSADENLARRLHTDDP